MSMFMPCLSVSRGRETTIPSKINHLYGLSQCLKTPSFGGETTYCTASLDSPAPPVYDVSKGGQVCT